MGVIKGDTAFLVKVWGSRLRYNCFTSRLGLLRVYGDAVNI